MEQEKNTTNMGTEWFNMKWILENNLLIATTEWITQDLENDWIVNFDKENVVLELTDVDSQKTIKYVKKGTQKIDLDESKKDEVLIGEWISQDVYPRALSLQSNNDVLSGVGMFDTENNIAYIETEFLKWSADGTTLKLLQSNGKLNEYTYKLEENHIILYKGEELINVYKKATNAKVEKLN